jgi:molecular chaperone IbpA
MATLDFTPLYRSSIGFDQVSSLLSHALEREDSGYPPYNIEKCGDDQYRIVMALAGFGKDDIDIVFEQNRLSVRGQKQEGNDARYLHRGIAARPFLRQFDLADYVEVVEATMGDGLLVVDLKRELPEALKPRTIPIGTGMFVPMAPKEATDDRQIESQAA